MVYNSTALEAILRRDRWITGAGLAAIVLLGWSYLISGSGMGMSLSDMSVVSLFPHALPAGSGTAETAGMPDMPGMRMSATTWTMEDAARMAAMWWIMMIAMMTPSAAPVILLFAAVSRRAHANRGGGPPAMEAVPVLTAAFTGGYLLAWLGFCLTATGLQWIVENAGLVSGVSMWSQSARFSALVLFAVGIYQWTPLKNVCLRHCRAPAAFLSRCWRGGRTGALWMGGRHGLYCLGCCWVLMTLLFVVGVMNVFWIVILMSLVLAEKLAPGGIWIARASGGALIAWSLATLAAC